MRKMLERLRSKNGSVLFLVVVVMSILILAASATYYVVTNQRSAVNVRYSSEQSYQTALSVSNTVWNYINGYLTEMNGKEVKNYNNTVVGKLLAGKTLTADDLDLTDMGLGKAEIEIKKSTDVVMGADGENTSNVFEIKVTADVNGETSTVTKLINIKTGPTEYFTRFLTCTGDSGEDVVISAGNLFGAAYFENEFTNFTQGATHINDSLYATGTVVDTGAQYVVYAGLNPDDYEIVINKNFYIEKSDGGALNNKYLFVGGDFELNDNKTISSKEVYICGNCVLNGTQGGSDTKYFIGGDLHINNNDTRNCTFYVNGDLYLGDDQKPISAGNGWFNSGTYYVNKNVYINANGNNDGSKKIVYGGDLQVRDGVSQMGTSVKDAATASSAITSAFSGSIFNNDSKKKVDFSNWSDIKTYIESSTTKQKYQEWNAEGYFDSKNSDNSAPVIDLDDWNTYLGTEYIRSKSGKDYFYISNKNFVLKSFDTITQKNVVINASSQNVYIKLQGELNPTTGRKEFRMGKSESTAVNLLITGKKSVVFVLPADTDFIMGTHVVIGHRDFLLPFVGKTFEELLSSSDNLSGLVEGKKNNISNFLKTVVQGNTTSKILDSTKVTGNAHNNIFLVTKGANNNFDFNAQANFCGYLYAPKGTMDCNSSIDRFAFFGGLIMGGYTYVDTSGTLAFTTPYDYYGNYPGSKKTNYVKNLMSEANTGEDGAGVGSTVTITGFDGNLGYK